MAKSVARLEEHYEVREAPFGRSYDWHPASATLECDCGKKSTLTSAASTIPTRRFGVDHSAVIRNIQGREERSRHEVARPWQHDAQERAEQHLLNEVAYPKGSPLRYIDITSGNMKGV
jgi:hypothetical protein